jgi:galactokinase
VPAERVVAFAPGRVNLIGEHTDYNEGLALPFAVTEGVTVRGSRVQGGHIHATALDLGEEDEFAIDAPIARDRGWRAFVRGMVGELAASGVRVPGARLEITGTVPRGAGLSSSAAVEVALGLVLLGLADASELAPWELAAICARVENEWVGAQTGLLDQIASLCGRAGAALEIDFRSQRVDPVPLALGDWRLVTLDSGERHAHAESGYNRRREECAQACAALGIVSLRDASLEMLGGLPAILADRARHVIGENRRVLETVAALRRADLREVGRLLDASHQSLRDLYDVSTPTVEATVATLHDCGAVGARMMGGGFGGQVLGLLAPGSAGPPRALEVHPGPGAHLVAQ